MGHSIGHEPTKEQCEEAAKKAIRTSREELEQRGFGWDVLALRLDALLNATLTEPFLGKGQTYKTDGESGKRIVASEKSQILFSKPLVAVDVRLKALVETFRLRGDYPPEEKRISGPGGGPIPLQKLEVEFVKPGGRG